MTFVFHLWFCFVRILFVGVVLYVPDATIQPLILTILNVITLITFLVIRVHTFWYDYVLNAFMNATLSVVCFSLVFEFEY